MQKLFLSVLILVLTTTNSLNAQNQSSTNFKIRGIVVDSVSNETVPFATISIFKVNVPISPVKRQPADTNGKFELTVSTTDPLFLTVEAVGMKTKHIQIPDLSHKTIDLGRVLVVPNDQMLSEVTVIAQKPLVKVDLDKITYDMKSDPESETSTTLDMLRKVPMVTVDGDENIQVKGQSNFKIFMNGKATNVVSDNPSQVLKSIPANTIKSIEVITEPGAKYEAEGLAGIINIITDKAIKGYTATVNAGVDHYGGVRGGIYYSTKIGKWGITTNLNHVYQKRPGNKSETNRESYDSDAFKYLNQFSEGSQKVNYSFGNLSVSYEMDSLNLFTVAGNIWRGAFNNHMIGRSWTRSASLDTVQIYRTDNESEGQWGGYDGSFDYQRSYSKPDKLFTASYKISYSPMTMDNFTDITAVKNYSDRHQHLNSNSSSTEHTFQLDYTEPFNKKHVLEAGVKYIYRINQSDNDYLLYNSISESWESMSGINDLGLLHKYGVLGAYGSYTYKLDKFSARAGARLEHTSANVNYNDSSFKPKPFTNLVPSITLSYQTTPGSNLQLSYTQRISRPDIWYLNPFVNSADPKNISQGNPDLVPEISNSFNLNYNLFTPKFNFNGSVFTSFANNSIEEISTLRDTIVYTTYENIGKTRNTGISAYFRWQVTKDFNWYVNSTGSYAYYSYTMDNQKIENDGLNFSAHLGTSYTLPKDFRINLNGGYASPSVSLQSTWYGYHYYGVSLNKSFLQKALNITLSANGFLQKYVSYKTVTTTDTYRSESIYSRQSPRYSISVSYRFGQMKERIKTVERGINNDDVKSGGQGGQGGESQGGNLQ
ncbi:MAG: TonB-dependent receptor domain-containing protein [Paludibacteraceae bacterium]